MLLKLVQNELGEFGVVDAEDSQYAVGTKGHRWTLEPIYWTVDKANAAAAKVRHQERIDKERSRNTYKVMEE